MTAVYPGLAFAAGLALGLFLGWRKAQAYRTALVDLIARVERLK